MSAMTFFHGSIPKRSKTTATQPDWAGLLQIGKGRYNCSVWKNRCKDGRPYLALCLSKQGLVQGGLKLALWDRLEGAFFEAAVDLGGDKLLFRAAVMDYNGPLELSIQPAKCANTEKLCQAIARLPIPVLWQALALPGTVGEHCCVRSPLRDDDRHPSFSIYAGGRRFKDHGTGLAGDAFDFFKLITKLESKTAYKRLLELAAIAHRDE